MDKRLLCFCPTHLPLFLGEDPITIATHPNKRNQHANANPKIQKPCSTLSKAVPLLKNESEGGEQDVCIAKNKGNVDRNHENDRVRK